MPEDSLKKVNQVIESDTILQKERELYPKVHDIYNLYIGNSLPLIKFEKPLRLPKKKFLLIKFQNIIERVLTFFN